MIEEYKNLTEKKDFFKQGDIKIDFNIEKIFDELEKFQTQGFDFIYRGCCEAKFKLYNSAQRYYLQNELYKQITTGEDFNKHYEMFIENLIQSCKTWNNSVISNFFKNSNINLSNSFAFLSYMQHNGIPTPFLDFTYNPYVALFFAIENINYSKNFNEIDNYFSLYYSFESTLTNSFNKYFTDIDINSDLDYQTLNKGGMKILTQNEDFFKIYNNLNILNQEGLFYFNNDPFFPLEVRYKNIIDLVKIEIGEERFKELLIIDLIGGCFNIHKSLIPAIKEKLKQIGITKEYIYPNQQNFKESVIYNGHLKTLTLKK